MVHRMKNMIRAIGMVSGGLDSVLAAALLQRQGIEIRGLYFFNGFSSGIVRKLVYGEQSLQELLERKAGEMSGAFRFPIDVVDVSEEFMQVLLSPRYGYGANVNPCIDCRIFLLKRAREIMEREGYDFIFSGEVLGQRPMSQRKQAMDLVERRSGLEGFLLRPLCAKLLSPTVPERDGRVDRGMLLDIQGRSRKRQLALAAELGVEGFSSPAGGCTLTDENYAARFRDLVGNVKEPRLRFDSAVLLSFGRHFRLSPRVKIVVGRNRFENMYLEKHWTDCWMAFPVDHPGPTTVILGEPTDGDLETAAAITARYGDRKHDVSVCIIVSRGETTKHLTVSPAEETLIDRFRI